MAASHILSDIEVLEAAARMALTVEWPPELNTTSSLLSLQSLISFGRNNTDSAFARAFVHIFYSFSPGLTEADSIRLSLGTDLATIKPGVKHHKIDPKDMHHCTVNFHSVEVTQAFFVGDLRWIFHILPYHLLCVREGTAEQETSKKLAPFFFKCISDPSEVSNANGIFAMTIYPVLPLRHEDLSNIDKRFVV